MQKKKKKRRTKNNKMVTAVLKLVEENRMSYETKANAVVEKAKDVAERSKSWADFSTAMFDQQRGLIAKTFKDEMERQSFYQSDQYEQINQLLIGVMKRVGMSINPAPPQTEKSGRFNVRIPKTLHRSLVAEAKRESVSLNQLALAKLTLPLKESTEVNVALVVQAFVDVHEGFSTERIVVDPEQNVKFLRRCHELGLVASDYRLNHLLYNIRKSKKQRDKLGITLPTTKRETEFRDFDSCQFAAEIAARIMQRTEGATLDRILCDPELGKKFDRLAAKFVNETRLKLRWAALNLRKTHRLQPIKKDAKECDLVSNGPVKSIDLSSIASFPGVYVFYDQNRPIYAGETDDLKRRITTHLQYGLPCIDVTSDDSVTLKAGVIPNMSQTERLQWLMEFINRERPLLNYQKVA
jgi:predicted HicB family RNase H-like nuclease